MDALQANPDGTKAQIEALATKFPHIRAELEIFASDVHANINAILSAFQQYIMPSITQAIADLQPFLEQQWEILNRIVNRSYGHFHPARRRTPWGWRHQTYMMRRRLEHRLLSIDNPSFEWVDRLN